MHCESCHSGGSAHARNPKTAICNPKKLTPSELNDFCGRCHRPPASEGQTIDWNYSWNVRHQPVYLSESRCFRLSEGNLSCFSCRDPHEPVSEAKPISAYNNVCRNCHQGERRPPKPVCTAEGAGNCVNCHMPQVSPQPPLRFTNHWIGVYRTGSKLKPAS